MSALRSLSRPTTTLPRGWTTLGSATRPSDAGHSGRSSLSGYRGYCCHEISGTGMCLSPGFPSRGAYTLGGELPLSVCLAPPLWKPPALQDPPMQTGRPQRAAQATDVPEGAREARRLHAPAAKRRPANSGWLTAAG